MYITVFILSMYLESLYFLSTHIASYRFKESVEVFLYAIFNLKPHLHSEAWVPIPINYSVTPSAMKIFVIFINKI